MISYNHPSLLLAIALFFGSALAGCSAEDECADFVRPIFEFQSGSYTVEESSDQVEIEFAADDDSFTITHEDGTVELFTRVSPVRQYP